MCLVALLTISPARGQSDPGIMTRYRALTSVGSPGSCSSNDTPDEVTVCGKRAGNRYRLGEVDAERPDRAGDARGERSTLVRAGSRCSDRSGLHGGAGCGGGLDVIAIGRTVAKAIDAIRGD